jgi:hypothetical protein
MATSEERMRILRMVQDGKITAEEASRLLEVLEGLRKPAAEPTASPSTAGPFNPGKGPRWVRIQVTDTNSGRTRVNVRLPVSVVSAGMKMGARFSPEVQGLDSAQLMELINSGETGRVMDVFDENDGEHVEVFLE